MKFLSWMTVTALLLGACAYGSTTTAGTNATRASDKAPTVRFLLVNDVYRADTLRDGSAGLSRVSALRDSIEKATGARVLYVLAGDVWSPSLLSKWYGGAQMDAAFNASRLDFATLGNHEFDGSRANLVARVAESRFKWLSANCTEKNGAMFPGLSGWDTVTVDGVRVGVFGTVIVREYPSYVGCRNADSVTHAVVDTLMQQHATLIVGITHRNFADDIHTLETEPNIEAILGGHDHTGRRQEVKGHLVVKAVSDARTAVLVTFTMHGNTWQRTDTSFTIGRGMKAEPATEAVVAAWRDTLTRRIGRERVLGNAPVAIDATDSTSHRGESAFGDLITDAMRAGTKSDVAMINTGALRFDNFLGPGPITNLMIESIFLFADETRAVTVNLSGARLRQLLEHGVATKSLGQGPYPQFSGVTFTYDVRKPDGQRIVGALLRPNGTPITDGEMLRVALVTYPACQSGDGYKVPEAAEVCKAVEANPESSPRTAALLIQYVAAMGGTIVAPPVGRIKRIGN
jgi:2',3'-cyclic-nucleotide 2'-phosphodiesterase (5'-nucleotidase family)